MKKVLDRLIVLLLFGLILIIVLLISAEIFVYTYNKINDSRPIPNPTPTINNVLNADKLWNMINDWEKQQGYQPYVKNDNLCRTAEKFLDFGMYWSDNYFRKNLKPYFLNSNYAWNFSIDRSTEEAVKNYWITNPTTKKNLTDYYYYSCIKCLNKYCLQLFMNLLTSSNVPILNQSNSQEWGKIKQINEYEYTSNFNNDSKMATPNEILLAVNNYRNQNGKSSVSWDDGLANWAQSRAALFASSGLDQHAGFISQIETQAQNMGLKGAGEDSSLGGTIEAVHLIEWEFAQDQPHKSVLLGDYNTIGIGVMSGNKGDGIDLIFGKK